MRVHVSAIVIAALCAGGVMTAAANHGGELSTANVTGRGHCDRQCLMYTMVQWTEALLSNDLSLGGFSTLRISSRVVATDNGNSSAVGSGALWGHVSRFQFHQTWADEASRTVMFYGTGTAGSTNTASSDLFTWYVVRLTMNHDGEITEVEEFEQPIPIGNVNAIALFEGDPLLSTPLPKNRQSSPTEMIKAVNSYWDALGQGATPGRGWNGLFHPDCVRNENGNYTSNTRPNSSCVTSLFFTPPPAVPGFTWNIDNRRYYIIDEETGIIFGIGMFHAVPGATRSFAVPEVFKIEDGLIRKMFAVFNATGATRNQVNSGWPDFSHPRAAERDVPGRR